MFKISKPPHKYMQIALVVLPALHVTLSALALRGNVGYFFLISILLVLISGWLIKEIQPPRARLFAHWMVVASVVGLSASAILTIEKIELLEDPNFITSCSISPIVACSPVIESDQASVFGFPNPVIGLFGYSAMIGAGKTILAADARKLHAWWWRTLFAGAVFGAIFSGWLMYEAFYTVNSLCLYCMSVWLVSFSLIWLVAAELVDNKILKTGRFDSFLRKPLQPIILSYIIVFGLIFIRWFDYWVGLI